MKHYVKDVYMSENGEKFKTKQECEEYEKSPEFREWLKKGEIKRIEYYLNEDLKEYDKKFVLFQEKYPEFSDEAAFAALLDTEEGRQRRAEIFDEYYDLDRLLFEVIDFADIAVNEYIKKFPEDSEFKKIYYETIRPEIDEETEKEWDELYGFTIGRPT